jgi:hypothetical protein
MSFEDKAEELLAQGAKSLEQGELDSAIKSLTMSLSYGGTAEAYLLRSKAFLQRSDYDNAKRRRRSWSCTACGRDPQQDI